MIPALISLVIGLILTFNGRIHLLKKPFTWSKISVIVLLLFSAGFSFWRENESGKGRKKDSEKIDSLTARANALNEQITYLRSESKKSQKEYEDSLVKYSKEHTTEIKQTTITMVDKFAQGTKTILEQASSDAKKLRDTIKVLKERQLPNLTYSANPENFIKCIQSHDTLYVLPTISNTGGSVAKNVNLKVYYLYSDGKRDYEYYKPIGGYVNGEVSPEQEITPQKGEGTYMTKFHFDSTNQSQFILVLGNYTNDEGSKDVVNKKLRLCYHWNIFTKQWGRCGDMENLEKVHSARTLIYFGQ